MIASSLAALVILLAVAIVTAFFTRRVPIPYVVTLAVVGVVAGAFVHGGPIHLSHELILLILLPCSRAPSTSGGFSYGTTSQQ